MEKKTGAISINPIRRFVHRKLFRKRLPTAGGLPFNWSVGYDVRDIVGPIAIKNQGTNDSCGGQAGSYAMQISRLLQGIKEGPISAKSIYAPIAYPGGGTTVSSLETQFCAKGGNLESLVPSMDANGAPLSESMMEDLSWQTPATIKDALTRAGYTPYDVPVDINSIASAIENYGFVIWEIKGQVNGTWASAYPQPPVPGATGEFFAHFMCACGAKNMGVNNAPTIIAFESEGISQGLDGMQFFQENYIDSGYVLDCFTFIPDGKIAALPSSMTPWNNLLSWFKSFAADTVDGLTGRRPV